VVRRACEAAAVADRSAAREAAAAAAAELVSPEAIIGLGSGRAVWATIAHLPAGTRAVVASERTREIALTAGIEVLELDGSFGLDLALDGADEVGPGLGLIKGGGGALLREKIVIAAAERFVVVAEAPKKVDRLGQGFRLPVEVVRFAWKDTRRRLSTVLPDAELRPRATGTEGSDPLGTEGSDPFVTDEGHYILDAPIPPEADPHSLASALKSIPGVVEHGLFLDMASLALLGNEDGSVERVEAAHS
jgi:ribose 5-phosphate isomerase A